MAKDTRIDGQLGNPSHWVSYTNAAYGNIATVKQALDELLYSSQSGAISNSSPINEVGTVLTSLTLNWNFNKDLVTASINQGIGAVNTVAGSYTLLLEAQTISSNTTYTLSTADGRSNVNFSTSVNFRYRRYWGSSNFGTLDNAQVLALTNNELATGYARSYSFSGLLDNYIYMAFPTAWGTPTFTVNGLITTFNTITIASFTNAAGGVTGYTLYRSINKLNGNVVVTVS